MKISKSLVKTLSRTRILRLGAALAALAVCTGACARQRDYPQAPLYVPHPLGEFPITASYSFDVPYMTDQQVEWAKEAGFNNIMKALHYQDTDSLVRLAEKNGMPMFIAAWEARNPRTAREAVQRYNGSPEVWGYVLVDEPNASQFPAVAQLRDSILRYAPDKNVFINLLPAVSPKQLGSPDYRTHVEDYVETVNPPFISLDIYPVKTDGNGRIYVDPVLYTTMEVIRDVSRESGRPFWSYILSNKHWRYPKPREEYIRFSVFTALAYGAQGLTYFTYLMPDFDKDKHEFSDAPIDWDGKRTKTWYMVRNVNREVQNLAKVFLGADVLEITQTGIRIPEGTRRTYRLPAPFRGIESSGEGVTVSHLRNGSEEYLLLVNRDVERKQKVRLSRTRPVTRLYGDGTERPETGPAVTLPPGGYALYRL